MPQDVQGRITVLIADDHPLLREGVAAILVHEPDIVLIAEAATGREAIDLFHAHRPDVTLMDLQMPGVKGDEAIKAIRKEFPDARILVVTTYDGDVRALRAMRAGACGLLAEEQVEKGPAGCDSFRVYRPPPLHSGRDRKGYCRAFR